MDDRESCLHVLTWIALRFIASDLSASRRKHFLSAFDEKYYDQGHTRGGDAKVAMIHEKKIKDHVRFKDLPVLDKLLEEFTQEVSHRYAPPHWFNSRPSALESSTWLNDTFKKHLQDRSKWPKNDGADPQSLDDGHTSTARKRTAAEAKIVSNHKRQPKTIRADTSNSKEGL